MREKWKRLPAFSFFSYLCNRKALLPENMTQTDTEALKAFFLHDEFARQNGIEIVEIAEGYARTQVRIGPEHLNAGGSVQGGVLFTLADLAFAAATNSHGTLTVTTSANITFVRGASCGIVMAEAKELVNHRHLPFCEVRVTDEGGNLLAVFTASGYRKEGVPSVCERPI